MDLLASLHLELLPEQQTRISHLSQTLAENPDLRLGFNACCVCATGLTPSTKSIECSMCRRVKYCSENCRERDATVVHNDNEEALGHSSVICSLLKLCHADEDAEDPKTFQSADDTARDRIQSEYESYPATLANALLEGPDILNRFTKRESKDLVIHVVGSSVEAELWGNKPSAWAAYGEALGQLAESKGLGVVHLHFVGPHCPADPISEDRRIPLYRDDHGSSSYRLVVTSHKTTYTKKLLQDNKILQTPDVVAFFNPGFTCTDYSWEEAMSCLSSGTAFIVTTNTEFEGISECQYMWEKQLLPSLPEIVAEILGNGSHTAGDEHAVFFSENPFRGNRVRQSGTMANDLFVKNSWVLMGHFGKPMASLSRQASSADKQKGPSLEEAKSRKKRRRGSPNSKETNPALI